ncbi:MAG TPA: hypothetical protein VG253_25920 [Streptosporangiaceae bacterium]|nr:hypothetical protein [Streptosporangiaceae bacterium]
MEDQRVATGIAITARERARSRLRGITATVGVAGIVGAGVVALNLPGSTHASTTSGTSTSNGSASAGQGSSSTTPSAPSAGVGAPVATSGGS